jgi:hypothetical protein
MIIKSMSRKTASFSQLLDYVNNGRKKDDEYSFRYNVYSHKPHYIIEEYLENHKKLRKQKNSNALYHEIISLKHQKNLTIEEQKEILKDLMEQFTKTRANNNLVYGVIHEQHNQVHCHLMISSNELESQKNKRLSLKQFDEIKEKLREYAYEKYPKLEKLVNEKSKRKARSKTRATDNEIQLKKRTGKKSNRELTKELLQAIITKSMNSQEFISALQAEKITIYQRGKKFGFLDEVTGRKYRVSTLGLENEFEQLEHRSMKMSKDISQDSEQKKTNASYEKGKKGKDYIREKILEVFVNSKSYNDFLSKLEAEQIQIYRAYDKYGFIDKMTNWKYHLDTLGLEKEFEKFLDRFDDAKAGKLYIKNIITEILSTAKSHSEFITSIQNYNIQMYRVENTFGFIDNITQRRYRLDTLEIVDEFNNFLSKIDNEKNVAGKEYVRDKIKTIFSNSKSYDEFLQALKNSNIQIYRLYDSFSFVDKMTNYKYTLESLGLENDFTDFLLKLKNDDISFSDKIKNIGRRLLHEIIYDIQYFATGKKPQHNNEVWTQAKTKEQDRKQVTEEELLKRALQKERLIVIELQKIAEKEAKFESIKSHSRRNTNKILLDEKLTNIQKNIKPRVRQILDNDALNNKKEEFLKKGFDKVYTEEQKKFKEQIRQARKSQENAKTKDNTKEHTFTKS